MLKVMIVDDEYMLLRGYRKIIDWQLLGLEVAVTEKNPLVALEILQTTPIDILISDMNMPEMDGPTFVTAAKKIRPEMELLVISGYSNFDYVKAGLQQGAVNYLKKPIDTEELIEALQEAIEHIEEQKMRQQIAGFAVQAQARTLLQNTAVETGVNLVQELGLAFGQQSIRLIGILNPVPPSALLIYLQTVPAVHGFFLESRDYIIIFQGDEVALKQFIDQMPTQVSVVHRPMIIGVVASSLVELVAQYQKLKLEISRQYFFESAAGLQRLADANSTEVVIMLPGYSQVKKAISGLTIADFRKWFSERVERLKLANASDVLVRQFALVVLLVLNEKLATVDTKTRAITEINNANVVSEIIKIIIDIYQEAGQTVKYHFTTNVMAMCRIIEQRYAEPLSLSSVAGELHLNAVYLGQLFKQDTGRSFSKYLNDYRINIALEMLHSSHLDVNYIASFVGYQNQGYFYKIFKQQTGMTPSEYREGVGIGSQAH
ncbi:response regulator transcription factor [Latilactobacillus fuchuensis]|uniref:Response regulator n=1 Tax=Latilactobacillus fuchuensis DSM 14340 = JCM 11249 TaxID=1423747 RepID=A0A0R1RYQ2_9LACO|nr:response regulator [Latilactobacillus fuchuensis]KRL61577.1 response regulator [Latilactobacillus fuchuensis DSM 14340 = JCM 11249]MCP8857636.1 response regulator [Latilactobacillus fuchuensis]